MNPASLFLAITEDMIAAITVPAVILIVFTISILTRHQRKMALILRQQPQVDDSQSRRIDMLQQQVSELKDMLQEHIIRTDGVQLPSSPPPQPNLEERLRQ